MAFDENGTIVCSDDSGICATMDEAGSGLGIFLQYLVSALPVFLIVLALIGGIVLIVGAVGYAIKASIGKGFHSK